MFAALFALLPGRDWLYIGAFILLGVAVSYERHHLIVEGEAKQKAEIIAASAKLNAANNAKLADMTKQNSAALAAIQEKQNVDLKAAAAKSADLAQRLRKYNAGRCPNQVLGSPAPAPASGAASAPSVDDAIAGVIAAAAHDHAIIQAERAERDALTGK